ncbi:hypothetical protein Tco_1056034 [Tanacetum coccineum]|uniref:Uncharacterized protein n=1 Tax=Tanacetum coccineum TaxID=301880 RepID=A0ABQ5H1C8_9ASTR
MFEVSTILEDDSAELVFGGANGLVKVSLSNSAASSFGSTFVEMIESDPGALAYLRLSLGHGTSIGITVVVRICPGGTAMADVSLEEEEEGTVFLPS